MKTVIIVSKCLRVTKFHLSQRTYEFHFKGVYAGEVVKKVILQGELKLEIKKGEEYLMYVRLISLQAGILQGHILKLKRLEECWDQS